MGNADYAAKLRAYARSAYQLTNDVAVHAPHEWTHAHLEARQRRLAARAAHRWRADFA